MPLPGFCDAQRDSVCRRRLCGHQPQLNVGGLTQRTRDVPVHS